MTDYAELIAEARAWRDCVPNEAGEVLVALADALEAAQPRHGLAMELLDLRAEVEQLRAERAAVDPDRAAADTVTAPFEVILRVYLDGFGTGAATALAKVKPSAPHAIVDDAAQALVNVLQNDPLAVEQLRDHVRRRLRGETDNDITEVPVWNGGE